MAVFMSLCTILSFLTFLSLSTFSLSEFNNDGFSVDLIHRDSIVSPLFNSTASYFDLIDKALQRSQNRTDYIASLKSFASTDLTYSGGDYLIKLTIGTPPLEIIGILDTASALSWTQCAPCDRCFPQKQPLFIPKKSSTFKMVPGNSKLCKSLKGRPSVLGNNACMYSLMYLDKSSSHGSISTDTVTMKSTTGTHISQEDFSFGCGYDNMGKFSGASGVIGLGFGPGSLITQMKSVIAGKFSYCLISNAQSQFRSSKMHFGNRAVVSGSKVLISSLHYFSSSYALRLKGISVGTKKLAMAATLFNTSSSSSKILGLFNERMVVDSGTLLSHLPKKLYTSLEEAIKKEVNLERANPRNIMRLCYKTSKILGPIITLHFVGANVRLYPINTFLKVSNGVYCLGFVPNDGVAVLGNLAQVNFLMGFDLGKMTLSFKPTDCNKE